MLFVYPETCKNGVFYIGPCLLKKDIRYQDALDYLYLRVNLVIEDKQVYRLANI